MLGSQHVVLLLAVAALLAAAHVGLLWAGRPRRGAADPAYLPTPPELAVMTGNGWAVVALGLLELQRAQVLTPTGQLTGQGPSRPLSPVAHSLRSVVEAPQALRGKALRAWFSALREHRELIWHQLCLRGLADSRQLPGRAGVCARVLKGGAVGLAALGLLAAMLVGPGVFVGGLVAVALAAFVLRRVLPPNRLTPAGRAVLLRAREELAGYDPRTGARTALAALDDRLAGAAVAVLGIGALNAWAPGLPSAVGSVPPAQLSQMFAAPRGRGSSRSGDGVDLDCAGSQCGGGSDASCSGGDGGGGCGGGCGGGD